jgi:ParB-like chromosome segregation protein Spo0J
MSGKTNRAEFRFQVMPPLSEEEYQALKDDIAENGVLIPVVEDAQGSVIDGHHRVRAVEELRAEGHEGALELPRVTRSDLATDAEKRDLAWRLNMQRRHLDQAQKRQAIAAKLKESPEWADNRIAHLLGVDGKTVRAERTSLEIRSEIPKKELLEGKDGKYYPRNRTGDLEAELALSKTDAVRQDINNYMSRFWDKGSDEARQQDQVTKIAGKWGVSPEHVWDQVKDIRETGPRLQDHGEEKASEMVAEAAEAAFGNVDQRLARAARRRMEDLVQLVIGYGAKRKASPEDVAEAVVEWCLFPLKMGGHSRRFDEGEQEQVREGVARYKALAEWFVQFVPLLDEKLEKRLAIEQEVSELRHDLQEDEGVNPPP